MKKKIKLRKFSKGWQFPKYQRKTKFTFKSKNQYGEFTTNKKIGTPTENETISPSEVLKIKKILKNFPGLKIFEYGKKGSGRYTIKLKVEKDDKIIQEDLTYNNENLLIMFLRHKIARKKLFPNQLSDHDFKKMRLLPENIKLSDEQFADKLNKKKFLTNKGNSWTGTSAFNVKRRLKLGKLGPRS